MANIVEVMKKERNKARSESLLGVRSADENLLGFVNTDIKNPVRGASYGVLLPEEDGCEASICNNNTL